MIRYELDELGRFVCDVFDETETVLFWTSIAVPEGMYSPRLMGGELATNGELVGGTWVDEDAPTEEEISEEYFKAVLASLTNGVQQHIDKEAQKLGYDSMLSLCSYATSSIPKFKTEGQAGVEFRDACWVVGHSLTEEVKSGSREIPTLAEVIELMPVFVPPAT